MVRNLNKKIANNMEFYEFVKNSKSRLFIVSSPLPIPFNFATHLWLILVDKNGKISRWDGWSKSSQNQTSHGLVHKNLMEAVIGMNRYFFKVEPRWNSTLLYELNCEISEEEFFEKLINYPFIDRYRVFPGPNSNTFVAWVVKEILEKNINLSIRAVGRKYKW